MAVPVAMLSGSRSARRPLVYVDPVNTARPTRPGRLRARTRAFYRSVLELLAAADIPHLVGGGYAFSRYTGIRRPPKDFDLFLRREDCVRGLELLAARGYRTELRFPHWLGKVWEEHDHIDLIFSSGNGIATVDDEWFEHAQPDRVFGMPVALVPPEEMIWSKAFIMERERFDGADVAHLLHAAPRDGLGAPRELDWARLLRRFEPHYRVLLSHVVLFGFAYPSQRTHVPDHVMDTLLRRLEAERAADRAREAMPARCDGSQPLCAGTLISREQYLVDIEDWGYEDARLLPRGALSRQDIVGWTDDIRR